MHSANLITALNKRLLGLLFIIVIALPATAQENSPYSRYGLGDLVPNRNMLSRAMGGISTGYADFQSLNLSNPAALGKLTSTTFDLGGEVDVRTLKSNISPDKYKSTNTLISYLQVGFPLSSPKMLRKGNSWGVSFGLKPLTRVNYKIGNSSRLSGIDSVSTLYEGSGGINQFNLSTGVKLKNLYLGITGGYSFGNKNYSTKLQFINDSIAYYVSNSETQTQIRGLFAEAGLQYDIKTGKESLLRLGLSTAFKQKLSGKRDNIEATISYDGNGEPYILDTVSLTKDIKGDILVPSNYSLGFTYSNNNWVVGADFDFAQWGDYRYYNQQDAVQNNWTIRAGAQYYPAKDNTPAKSYWSFVKYRAGFYYGPDYIKLNVNRPNYAVTLGAGLPLTSFQQLRRGEYVTLNTGVEIGARGNKNSQSMREGLVRINFGISMNARWFQKVKYD